MGALKDAGIRSLQDNPAAYESAKADPKKQDQSSLRGLFESYLNTTSKSKREKMLREFSARRLELAGYIKDHPELIAAEAQRALIAAALGGDVDETETEIDSRGRKKHKRRTKRIEPNVAAIIRLLDTEVATKPENNLADIIRESLAEEGTDDAV